MRKRVYLLVYILLGIAAAIVHLLYDGRPAIGASGAIMGILGLNMVICFNKFSKVGPWLIIFWLCSTIVAGVTNTTATAHMEHFSGFLCCINKLEFLRRPDNSVGFALQKHGAYGTIIRLGCMS